jgi:hypothetical protein
MRLRPFLIHSYLLKYRQITFGGVFMAGNSNSGRNPAFHLSEKELAEKIDQYKKDLENGLFARASWPHFAAYLDSTEADLADVIKQGANKDSAYKGRAEALKKMLTWTRGQMMSAQSWNGQLTSRAIFALKQDHGDGVKWVDQEAKQTGPVDIRISFGGDDPRASKACK